MKIDLWQRLDNISILTSNFTQNNGQVEKGKRITLSFTNGAGTPHAISAFS